MMIKVIGLGGIGSNLISPLCRHLDATYRETEKPTVVLIDGDKYEAKNANRQEFLDVGNKAEMSATRMAQSFPDLPVEAKPVYVSEENIFFIVNDGDIVLLGVDNHATRKLVSDHCQTLENVVLISGGNELLDGNIQIHVRRDGKNITPPITYLHPEIETPTDRNPAEMSCEDLESSGVTQIIFTNLTAAIHMLSAYRMASEFLSDRGELLYSEQFFDVASGNTRAFLRKQS
jgi:molybdopterin/thiamine biosynthesis adenylyltransferase